MQSDDFTALEAKLRRSLMPVALREEATDSIHAMLDGLAASAPAPAPLPAASRAPWIAAAAAAIALIAATAGVLTRPDTPAANAARPADEPVLTGNMHLVDESTRLASIEDAGWHTDPDGATHQALRVRVVEEDRLLDEDTGFIVNITSPREEMLLTPVSTF